MRVAIAIGCAALVLSFGAAIAKPTVPAVPVPPTVAWTTSTTEAYRGKRDDIFFANARTGFYGTGAGDLFRSDDGGATWKKTWSKPGTFIRALGFVDANDGFLGNVGDSSMPIKGGCLPVPAATRRNPRR